MISISRLDFSSFPICLIGQERSIGLWAVNANGLFDINDLDRPAQARSHRPIEFCLSSIFILNNVPDRLWTCQDNQTNFTLSSYLSNWLISALLFGLQSIRLLSCESFTWLQRGASVSPVFLYHLVEANKCGIFSIRSWPLYSRLIDWSMHPVVRTTVIGSI